MPTEGARPFRFAVQASRAGSARAWRDLAAKIEDLGYSTLYVPDHLDDQWGPLVALTVAAEATSTLRVGSLVLDNDYRHPVVLAKELATLDLVSEGRLEAGLGAGWMKTDYEQSGIALDPPGTRVERLAEAVTVMKALWSEGTVTFSGRHYTVTAARGWPRPHRPGGPPLVIGGGSRRVLSLAATEADVVGINPSLAAGQVGPEVAASSLAERFAERVAWVREAAGERFSELELQCLTFAASIVPDGREMRAALAPSFGITADEAAEVPIVLVGSEAEVTEALHARRERYGLSYWVVHEDAVESFAPVVGRLAGR
ncbi:MAG: TIGR03621 family F420-dependent LLM class oxidoreductase [Acidimicrobiales bacterium]